MAEQRQITLDEVKKFIRQMTPNKDWLYIFQPFGIGDFLYTGGLSLAVQKRNNKSATVLIVNERMENLNIIYENVADIILLNADTMDFVKNFFYVTGNYEGDNYIYGHFHRTASGSYDWDESLHLIDRYKKDVFKIPMDTPYEKPIVSPISEENIAELHAKYILDKDKTIVITPYTYSTKPLDMRFWMFLVMVLTEKGYVIYTNVSELVEHEKPIPGTEPISINFRELYYISDKVKCFLGSRVGIFDFLVFTDAKTINITPFPSWLWDVNILYPNSRSRTLYNAMDYIAPLLENAHKDKVHAEMKLSHEHINNEDICYSYEEILNNVLNEVEKI